MREFKFRCYDKNESYMLPWEHLMDAGDLSEMLKFGHEEDAEYSKLMQYTGIKDKNGVEIYEGDVIEYRESIQGQVVWVCDYRQQGNYLKTKDSLLNVLHPADNFVLEVIGNIYENSELLEESK